VDFVAFDAGLKPFPRWEDNVRMWEWIVGMPAAGAQPLTVNDGYRARDAINAIPGLERPPMLHVLAFMLVYTLLIGPVNYVVLRKLDRRELAWLTIPALIVGFTACAYVTGFQIRGGTAIVHRLAAVYVPQGSQVGRVSQVVGLFSPRRAHYDVWVAGARVRPIAPGFAIGPSAGAPTRPLHVVEQLQGVTVTGLRVDVGGVQPFVAEGYAHVPAVDADLQLVDGTRGTLRVEGALRNGDIPLREAVVIAGDVEQRLGDLQAGQQASVDLYYRYGYDRLGTPDQILGTTDYWGDRELHRRYQWLETLSLHDTPAHRLDAGRGVYLVGWAEAAPASVEVMDRPFSTHDAALYVYALPVAAPREDQSWPP
jgi:hypothetical protein